MRIYVLVLPLLASACGFVTTPFSGDDDPMLTADEIARLSDGGATGSAALADAAMAEPDAELANPSDAGRSEIDSGVGVISDSGHIGAGEDAGHLEQPDAAAPAPDAAEPTDVSEPPPDAMTPPEKPRAVCFACMTDAGCTTDALCYRGFCMPRMTSTCENVCGGALPRPVTTVWKALSITVQVCTPDDGAPSLGASCLNFFAAGSSCD